MTESYNSEFKIDDNVEYDINEIISKIATDRKSFVMITESSDFDCVSSITKFKICKNLDDILNTILVTLKNYDEPTITCVLSGTVLRINIIDKRYFSGYNNFTVLNIDDDFVKISKWLDDNKIRALY